jgi:hypothetical protein
MAENETFRLVVDLYYMPLHINRKRSHESKRILIGQYDGARRQAKKRDINSSIPEKALL